MRAVAACRRSSAAATSGRRRSRSRPACRRRSAPARRAGARRWSSCAINASGTRPVSTAMRCSATATCASSCGHDRERAFQLRARARGVELGAAAGIHARLHDAQRALAGSRRSRGRRAGVPAGRAVRSSCARRRRRSRPASPPGRWRWLPRPRDWLRRCGARGRTGRVPIRRRRRRCSESTSSRPSRDTPGAWSALSARTARVALRGDRRDLVEPGVAQQRIRLVVARQRDAQVVVRGEGFFDERGQLRVAEASPEGVVGAARQPRSRRWRASSVRANCPAGGRPHVVGADRARREQGRGQHGQREAQHSPWQGLLEDRRNRRSGRRRRAAPCARWCARRRRLRSRPRRRSCRSSP